MTEIELNGPRLYHILVARDAQLDKPLKSVTHGRQTYTATDTFSDAGHHRPLNGTKLYSLATVQTTCPRLLRESGTAAN